MAHPALRDCEERVVWLSIIERAAWADTTTFINGRVVGVKRGSFFTSLRTLCDFVSWDAKKVSRFLRRLEECHMIATANDTGMTQISVCNYDKYNPPGHIDATVRVSELPHKEEINNKEKNIGAAAPGWHQSWDAFHHYYPCGLHENGKPRRWPKSGRNSAMNVFKDTIQAGATVAELIKAAENYAAEKSNGRYVMNPKRFLKDGDWRDWLEGKDTSDTAVFKKDWDYQ
jgi:hypothetical protein